MTSSLRQYCTGNARESTRRFVVPRGGVLGTAVGVFAAAAYTVNAAGTASSEQQKPGARDYVVATTDKTKRLGLYPPIEPYNHGMLKVIDSPHVFASVLCG